MTLLSRQGQDGSTSTHCATLEGPSSRVDLLLNHGADVNAKNNNDHWGTLRHAAAHANQRAIAELLIAHGANINATNLMTELTG